MESTINTELLETVKFNKKSFNDKVLLSFEMATYWDLALLAMDNGFYKEVCNDQLFILELEDFRQNNQFDIALLKLLHYLNPDITNTLKDIIVDDINISSEETLLNKGKLKYRGGELIPNDVYNHETYNLDALPTEGEVVYTQNGTALTLGKLIGDGGEGFVYKTNKRSEVIKLIKPVSGKMRVFTQKKIEQMIKMKITNSQVIWPLDTIYNKDGLFIGFTMNYISGIDLKTFTSSIVKNVNDNSDDLNINEIDKKTLCKIILSILDTIMYLHDKNIIIGDIKLENFMIKGNDITNIYFIDCDSYQLGNYPCLLVSPGFVPPEIDSINLGKQNCTFRTFGNENFAIFSLLFHLVFRAKPPYSQQIHDDSYISETTRVTNGMFPYFLDKVKTLEHCPKGMEEPIWAHLPGYVKKAFISVGSLNGRNFGEENRLTPKQWRHIFQTYLDDLNNGKLVSLDSRCNLYHFGMDYSIAYDEVDIEMPTEGFGRQILSMEETIIQTVRNNDYIKNMIMTNNINNKNFNNIKFHNKIYNNKVLFSLELIKNWNLALEFIKEEPLASFALPPVTFHKITDCINKRKYSLALFIFIKALNKDIFLAYDGLIFNSLDEYSTYLGDYYHFVDKVIIPFDILNEVIDDNLILSEIKKVYSKTRINNDDLDNVINLLSSSALYSKGVCYTSLDKYLLSIYKEELNINVDNLLIDSTMAKIILAKYNIDSSKYDFKRKDGYHNLIFKLTSSIPFKFENHIFFSMEDVISYSKSDADYNEKFKNIGRWINSGVLKLYSNFYPRAHKISGNQIDVFKMVSDYKLEDWEAGHLFYLLNAPNPVYVTKDNVVIKGLKELMEILLTLDDVEEFTHNLYSNCLFECWCDIYKKPENVLAY